MATPHSAFSRKWRNAIYLYNFDFFIRNDWLGAQNMKKSEKNLWQRPICRLFVQFLTFFIRNDWLGVKTVSPNPEQKKERKNYGDAPFRLFQEMAECHLFYNIWLLHQFYKKNCNVSFGQLQKRISKYQNMDIDYNIGHYRSEIGLSVIGTRGYFVTFVPYKYQKSQTHLINISKTHNSAK